MPPRGSFHPAFKIFLFWAAFLLLHFLYQFVPIFPVSLVSGTSEAFFQHLKSGFYAYLLVCLAEAARYWRHIEQRKRFVYTRLLACLLAPWVIFLVWFLHAALYGRLPSIPLEVAYANLAVVVSGMAVVALERSLDEVDYSSTAKITILGLFIAAVVLFVASSQRLPWTDVFTEPSWRP